MDIVTVDSKQYYYYYYYYHYYYYDYFIQSCFEMNNIRPKTPRPGQNLTIAEMFPKTEKGVLGPSVGAIDGKTMYALAYLNSTAAKALRRMKSAP
jgi:hypothetical protein